MSVLTDILRRLTFYTLKRNCSKNFLPLQKQHSRGVAGKVDVFQLMMEKLEEEESVAFLFVNQETNLCICPEETEGISEICCRNTEQMSQKQAEGASSPSLEKEGVLHCHLGSLMMKTAR